MVTKTKHAGLGHALTALFVSVGAVAACTQAPAVEQAPAAAPLVVSEARTLAREGGRNPDARFGPAHGGGVSGLGPGGPWNRFEGRGRQEG